MKTPKPRRRPRWGRMVAVVLAGVVISLACEAAAPVSETSSGAKDKTPEDTVEVMLGGDVLATLSVSDVRALPQVSVDAGPQPQIGPTLRSVLSELGVGDFEKVTVTGMLPGRVVRGELTLTSAEITDEVILAINRRGKLKLASPSIPSERWIIDVTRIVVE